MKTKLLALAVTGLMSAAAFAAEPDTNVIEYYHPILKHYFITASATDARLMDTGYAGADWVRTGRSFGAWSSRSAADTDATMVHRFYSAGAVSHFFTGKDDEIQLLKSLEAKERAEIAGTNKPFLGWGYEGEAFLAVLPKNGVCPAATETISRTYNYGYETGEGGNHRYVSDDSLKRSMEDRKWVAEGVALCAPKSSSSSSGGGSNNSSSGVVAPGSYSGTVLFKFEQVGQPEVKVRAALTLTLAANGALSGTGGGCAFAGTAVSKSSGDKPLLGGALTASGCSDARFNGTYGRVEIEQFSAKAIDIRFKKGDGAREAEIEGVLNLGSGSTTPNPTPTPVPPSAVGITGDFAGLSTWVVTERLSGQQERVVLNVNQNLALQITAAGLVTGSGQGCKFSGTLTPGINNRFNGVVTAAGCTDTRLNGSFQAEVHPEDGGAIEAEFEREIEAGGSRTKVTIKGNLSRSANVTPNPNPNPTPTPTPNPTPTAPGIAIAGNYSGSATFLATRRPSGGRETTEVNSTQALSIAVSGTGNVTGSGGGCSFSGKLTSNAATPSIFTGTVTATGCTNAIVSGTYSATASREDAGIELELERETEISGERVKVKIKGRLGKQ
jgi:hypothetical protein